MGVQAKMNLTYNILVLGVFLSLAVRSSWGISGIVETADIKLGLFASGKEPPLQPPHSPPSPLTLQKEGGENVNKAEKMNAGSGHWIVSGFVDFTDDDLFECV